MSTPLVDLLADILNGLLLYGLTLQLKGAIWIFDILSLFENNRDTVAEFNVPASQTSRSLSLLSVRYEENSPPEEY